MRRNRRLDFYDYYHSFISWMHYDCERMYAHGAAIQTGYSWGINGGKGIPAGPPFDFYGFTVEFIAH